tara:strand:+ start:717 stop:860 length:144 start_codon:yes stop_codon:yes gene_type:complete
MKKPKDYQAMGVIYVATGVVFMISANKPLGIALMVLGGLFMFKGKKK